METNAENRDAAVAEETPVVFDPAQLPDQEKDGEEVTGTEKALKDTKAELTRLQQERAKEREEFAERLARLEGTISALKQVAESRTEKPQDHVPDPFAFLDDGSLKERFYEDADVPITAIKRTVEIIGRALAARDAEIDRKLKELEGKVTYSGRSDPALAEKIAELKKDPELASLDDKALLVIAKRFAKDQESSEWKEYPGSPPTGSRRPSGGMSDTEFEKAVKAKLKEYLNA